MFKDSSRSPPELETVDNDDVEAEMVDDFWRLERRRKTRSLGLSSRKIAKNK